jgi:hypothetical protein
MSLWLLRWRVLSDLAVTIGPIAVPISGPSDEKRFVVVADMV